MANILILPNFSANRKKNYFHKNGTKWCCIRWSSVVRFGQLIFSLYQDWLALWVRSDLYGLGQSGADLQDLSLAVLPIILVRTSHRLFVCLFGFLHHFQHSVQVRSCRVVLWAEETSTYSWSRFYTVNCRPTASNYQLSHLRSGLGIKLWSQRWEARVLPLLVRVCSPTSHRL